MNNLPAWLNRRVHHGVVLDVSQDGFDKGAAAFATVFIDKDDPTTSFMFYSGARDVYWSHSAIGLAISNDGLKFQKVSGNPILEGTGKSFCYKEAVTPAVTKVKNRLYMIFSGRPSRWSSRRLGIAWADDPKGPWHLIGELIKPAFSWEGRWIDNGPSIVHLDEETVLVFYSNASSSLLGSFLRGYPIRRIGILKVRIRGTSKSRIEAHRFQRNPLKHLNGPRGSWNESLFCPGYMTIGGTHYLFPAASTYSIKFPHKQYIGMVASSSPFFIETESSTEILIDGPLEKSSIMPLIKGEIALDTPAPVLRTEENELFLYHAVNDRADGVWKTALTTFDLKKSDQ